MPLPELSTSERPRPVDPDFAKAPFMGVFGFSIIGLLLCCLLLMAPKAKSLLPIELLLIVVGGPLAAWLGLTLGGGE